MYLSKGPTVIGRTHSPLSRGDLNAAREDSKLCLRAAVRERSASRYRRDARLKQSARPEPLGQYNFGSRILGSKTASPLRVGPNLLNGTRCYARDARASFADERGFESGAS